MPKKILGIDVGKIICAIIVISSHAHLFEDYQGTLIYTAWDRTGIIAVRLFFVISGYFIGIKMRDQSDGSAVLKNSIVKFFKLYILWTLIYLPATIYGLATSGMNLKECIWFLVSGLFFYGSSYWSWQLWYLLGLLYSLIIIWIFCKWKLNKTIVWVILSISYLFGFLFVYGMIPTSFFTNLTEPWKTILWDGRMFTCALFVWMGIQLSTRQIQYKKYYKLFALAATVAFVFTPDVLSVMIWPPAVLAFFAFFRTLKCPEAMEKLQLGPLSSNVYYIHMYLVFILTCFCPVQIDYVSMFFIVTVMSIVLGYLIIWGKSKVTKKDGLH